MFVQMFILNRFQNKNKNQQNKFNETGFLSFFSFFFSLFTKKIFQMRYIKSNKYENKKK